MGINHITVMGNIARGPEFRMTPNGVPTASFSLAVVRPPRQEGGAEVTDYVKVVVWRALAEKVNESIAKGDLVTVEGRLTTRSYETQDGQKRKTIEVEASQVEAVRGAKPAGAGRSPASAESGPADDYGPPDDDFSDFGGGFEEKPAAKPVAAKRPAPPKAPVEAADLDDEIPF